MDRTESVPAEVQKIVRQVFMEMSVKGKTEGIERFRRLNQYVKPGQILFAGSSLMEQFPIYEFLQDFDIPLTIYNRGLGGYTTTEMLDVMDVCVYDLKPAHIFLNIGTNDLNDDPFDMDALIERYSKILDGIHEHLPEAKLYLLAYYPVNPEVGLKDSVMSEIFKHRTNQRIKEASAEVQKLAKKYDAEFLDLNAGLLDKSGNLKAEYTVEGMHMYADGYRAVFAELLQHLMKLKQK